MGDNLPPLILGIDPGPEESALVWIRGERIERVENASNHDVARIVKECGETVAIEDFQPYGVRLGHESMATIKWVGIFAYLAGERAVVIARPDVKQHLCNCRTAKDADVRDAIIHRYGCTSKTARGTKKEPGPLYSVSGHAWAALAVALVALDRM